MKLFLDSLTKRDLTGDFLQNLLSTNPDRLFIVSPYITGKYSDSIIRKIKKISDVKIICDVEGGDCNPYLLLELLNNTNIKIRSRGDVHAKVYLFDNCVLLGSNNLTTRSLGTDLMEGAVLIQSKDNIRQALTWFKELWKDTKKRSEDIDWQKAKAKWDSKPERSGKSKPHILDMMIADEYNNFLFQFYTEDACLDQDETIKFYKRMEGFKFSKNVSFYEENEIPYKNNSLIRTELENLAFINDKYKDHYVLGLSCKSTDSLTINSFNFKSIGASRFLCMTVPHKFRDNAIIITFHEGYPANEFKFAISNTAKKNTIFCDWLNRSLQHNRKEWQRYFKSKLGNYWFCEGDFLKNILLKNIPAFPKIKST
jgi:hypothetical protein